MMIKIMMAIFTVYITVYVISMLFPNASNPEVNINNQIKFTLLKNINSYCFVGYALCILE